LKLVQNILFSCLLSKNLKIKIHIIIVLPILLYGCETWSVTLREECTLSVFENRVLQRVFGPMWEEFAGGWERLHNEELHNLDALLNFIKGGQIKEDWMGGAHSTCRRSEKCI
jgi:hypothetical protein